MRKPSSTFLAGILVVLVALASAHYFGRPEEPDQATRFEDYARAEAAIAATGLP